MQIVIDLILLGVFLAVVIISAKKGIVRTILEVVAFVLALVLAAQLSGPLAKGVYDSMLSERVESKIEQKLSENENASASKKLTLVIDSLPGFAQKYMENSDSEVTQRIAQMTSGTYTAASAAADLNTEIARPVCVAVLTSIFFLLLFVVLCAILEKLAKMLSKAFKLPIVGTVNTVLGGVFGAIKGCVLVLIAASLLMLLAPRIGGTFGEAVDGSQIIQLIESYTPSLLS